MRHGVLLCVLATGCGRLGFEASADPDAADAPEIDARLMFSTRITSGNDDAEEASDGVMYLDSTDLELCDDLSSPHLRQVIGLRFVGIPAPRGARVIHASIQFTVEGTPVGGPGMLVLRGQRTPALPFTADPQNVSARPQTTASTFWTPALWSVPEAAGPDQRTPELAAIVEEILAQPEWTPGSALALVITGTGTNQAHTFDGVPMSAPELFLELEL